MQERHRFLYDMTTPLNGKLDSLALQRIKSLHRLLLRAYRLSIYR